MNDKTVQQVVAVIHDEPAMERVHMALEAAGTVPMISVSWPVETPS